MNGSKQRNGNGRRPRRWLPYLALVAFLAFLVVGFWPKPAPVETTKVVSGKLRATINEEGKTRIRQRYVVSAPVIGQLRRIPFKAGTEISSTQTVVAVIDPANATLLDARSRALAEAGRDAAAAQLERARAQHTMSASELKRAEKLSQEKTLSAQELEQTQMREIAAAREFTAAEAALRQAEASLREFSSETNNQAAVELKSPAAGRVLKVFEESARTVAIGTPLLEIGDPNDLEVIIENLSRDAAIIRPGMAVELEQWGGGEPLQAVVRYVEPKAFTKVSALGVEEQRVYVVADLVTPSAQRGNLGDNFRVEARIITWQNKKCLKVPNGAIFRRDENWFAYVVVNGRAKLSPMKTGHASDTETEILDGLKEGDEIILYPGDRIQDGLRVKVVKL
jgi:HlyD family secretion protein